MTIHRTKAEIQRMAYELRERGDKLSSISATLGIPEGSVTNYHLKERKIREGEMRYKKLLELSKEDLLKTSITEMNWATRTLNCLVSDDIETFGDLITYNQALLCCIPDLGRKTLRDIEDKLKLLGLEFSAF